AHERLRNCRQRNLLPSWTLLARFTAELGDRVSHNSEGGRCALISQIRDGISRRWCARTLVGTSAVGSNLSRTAPATAMFDAGASSTQTIGHGDAYVEFEASEANASHVIGLALGGSDSDPGITDIGFAISLIADGRFYVIEGGSLIPGPDLNQSFG